MNIKLALFTLVIGSTVCLTTLPVQADTWKNFVEKQEKSNWRNQQGDHNDDNDKTQRSGKDRSDKPAREEPRREKKQQDRPRRENTQRDRNDRPKWDREKPRPVDRRPAKHFDKDRHDRPITWREKNRHDMPLTWRDKNRHPKPVARIKRPKHRIIYHDHVKRKYRYIRGPWYYTRYIRPYPLHFHPIGFQVNILPRPYVRLVIGGFPYFYYSGIFYRQHNSSYIVVGAPIGAFVTSLPEGFIAFSIGLATYYYINDAYYVWDDYRDGYVVVEKPTGAEEAIEKATSGRLVVYPNKDQSEEQQAKDRYECHRWAVTESGIDPTLEEEEYAAEDSDVYRRAIAACLEGRDYTVK